METVKQPAMILSVANSAGLVGAVTYFYKRLGAIQEELSKLSENLSGTVKKVAELQGQTQQLTQITEALKHLNQGILHNKNLIFEVQDQQEEGFEAVDTKLADLVALLNDNGLPIEMPEGQDRSRGNNRRGGGGNNRRGRGLEEKDTSGARRGIPRRESLGGTQRNSERSERPERNERLERAPARSVRFSERCDPETNCEVSHRGVPDNTHGTAPEDDEDLASTVASVRGRKGAR